MVFWAPCVTDNEDYSLIIILIVPAGLFTVFTTLSFTFQDDADLGLVSDDNTPCQGNLEEKCS